MKNPAPSTTKTCNYRQKTDCPMDGSCLSECLIYKASVSATFHQTSPPPNTAVNDTNEKLKSTSNKTCHIREQTRNVQATYRKTDKIQKNGDRQPTKHREKGYNLRSSTYQNATLPNSRYRY